MSVIYDHRTGVSLSLGTVIPNVLLNAIGFKRAWSPVATVETPKMSAIPLKTRRRVEVGMVGPIAILSGMGCFLFRRTELLN
jgi:hypothetical protein